MFSYFLYPCSKTEPVRFGVLYSGLEDGDVIEGLSSIVWVWSILGLVFRVRSLWTHWRSIFSKFLSKVFSSSVQDVKSVSSLSSCALSMFLCYLVSNFGTWDLWFFFFWRFCDPTLESEVFGTLSLEYGISEGLCLKVFIDVFGDLECEGSKTIEGLWYKFWIWVFGACIQSVRVLNSLKGYVVK